MSSLLAAYAEVAGEDIIRYLRQLSAPLAGRSVVHVNSTRLGGGGAEILHKLVPLSHELGIDTHWEVISGDADFYECAKLMHNALQGSRVQIPERLLQHHEAVNEHNAAQLRPLLEDADFVVIHDPQPAAMLRHSPNRRGQWVWRCHIDASRPQRHVWRFLERHVRGFDAASSPCRSSPARSCTGIHHRPQHRSPEREEHRPAPGGNRRDPRPLRAGPGLPDHRPDLALRPFQGSGRGDRGVPKVSSGSPCEPPSGVRR